ncbi:MAG: phosphoesterase [Gammaproteobacteria bacterium RIFCSPHIGHO2_12_FULL_45_9]|nr:MAG: phosphoesterase [Gammaproteobacteria bacterium RIFCSPHIGHO2_12_FULL_45_9]
MAINPDAHWRDSARSVRFFIWDGKTAFPMVLFLVHIQWWTLWIALGATLFFTVLRYYGFTMDVFGRIVRNFFAGARKIAIPWWEA